MDDWGRGKCTLIFDPPLVTSTRGWVRAAVDGAVLASWNAQEMSGALHTLTPAVAWTTLPASDRVNRTTPTLMWEVSPDGEHWFPAGASGPHTMYWTEAAPIVEPFEGWGAQVYDKPLEIACGGAAAAPALDARVAIAQRIGEVTTYYPAGGIGAVHPLSAVGRTDPDVEPLPGCEDLANLLRGVLRSAGFEGDVRFFYNVPGGDRFLYSTGASPAFTLQIERPPSDLAPENPHFRFHAIVRSGDSFLDASLPTCQVGSFWVLTSVDPATNPDWAWRDSPCEIEATAGISKDAYDQKLDMETNLVCSEGPNGCRR